MSSDQITVVHIEVEGKPKAPYISGDDLIRWLKEVENGCEELRLGSSQAANKITQETVLAIAIIRESIESYCQKE